MAAALHLPYVPLSEPILVFTDGTYQSGPCQPRKQRKQRAAHQQP